MYCRGMGVYKMCERKTDRDAHGRIPMYEVSQWALQNIGCDIQHRAS